MARGRKHNHGSFYKNPCEIEGYQYPPIMISLRKFALTYNYSEFEVVSLLRDKQLFGKTFKKNMWVCPCPLSYMWTPEIIEQFWTKV